MRIYVRGFIGGTLALMLLGAGPRVWADVVELKNDGLVDGGQVSVQLGFVNGEIGCASYTLPPNAFPLEVLRVQIFWRSYPGSQPDSLQDSIRIYSGSLPSPTLIDFIEGPVLVDGFLNEFDIDFLDIFVNTPGTFTVGLKFDDAPDGDPFKPSLCTDRDGCQTGKNPIFAVPQGWRDLCSFGVTGDLVIRTIVATNAPTYQVGDMNCDGLFNAADIPHFVQAMADPEGYVADHDGTPYPACDINLADCSGNGLVNAGDIPYFVDLLVGGK